MTSNPLNTITALSGTATAVLPANLLNFSDTAQVSTSSTWNGMFTPEGWGNANTLTVNWTSGAGNTWSGARTPLLANVFFTSASNPTNAAPFYAAAITTCNIYTDDNGTGVAPKGDAFGLATVTYLKSTVKHWDTVVGYEADVVCESGCGVLHKIGIDAYLFTGDAVQGTVTDAAFMAAAVPTTPGWRNGYQVGDGLSAPLSSDGSAFSTFGSFTATNAIDVSSATFTGFLFKSSTYKVTGAGVATSVGISDGSNATTGYVGEYITAASASGTPTTATVTIASPAVVTNATVAAIAGASVGASTIAIVFATSGALPTGITAGTVYWVINSTISGNTFQIATSAANALAGTAINTSGSQSGTHTITVVIPLVSGTAASVVALQLTAGDWDVSGVVGYRSDSGGTTTVTISTVNISGTANTLDTATGKFIETITASSTPAANAGSILALPPYRMNITSPTTVYLNALSVFATSTNGAYGKLSARRIR